MTDPFAEQRVTVTVIQRVPGARDEYGNTTWTEERTDVPGCLVAWTGSAEDQNAGDRVTDSATVYDVRNGWPADAAVSRVEIGGTSWEIDGDVAVWPGSIGGTVVQLRKVSG